MTISLRYLNSFKFFKVEPGSARSLAAEAGCSWNNYLLTEMVNTAISTIAGASSYCILKLGLLLNTLIDYLDISGVSFVSKRVVENISRILGLTDFNPVALLYSNLLLKFTSSPSFFQNKYFDNCFFDWMDRLARIRPPGPRTPGPRSPNQSPGSSGPSTPSRPTPSTPKTSSGCSRASRSSSWPARCTTSSTPTTSAASWCS